MHPVRLNRIAKHYLPNDKCNGPDHCEDNASNQQSFPPLHDRILAQSTIEQQDGDLGEATCQQEDRLRDEVVECDVNPISQRYVPGMSTSIIVYGREEECSKDCPECPRKNDYGLAISIVQKQQLNIHHQDHNDQPDFAHADTALYPMLL